MEPTWLTMWGFGTNHHVELERWVNISMYTHAHTHTHHISIIKLERWDVLFSIMDACNTSLHNQLPHSHWACWLPWQILLFMFGTGKPPDGNHKAGSQSRHLLPWGQCAVPALARDDALHLRTRPRARVKFDEVRVRWRRLRGWHPCPSPNFWLELDPQWSTRPPGFVPHIPGIVGFPSVKTFNAEHRHACTLIIPNLEFNTKEEKVKHVYNVCTSSTSQGGGGSFKDRTL